MQAIRSKLRGENIIDVKEIDLFQFQNLTHLDLSDNNIQMHQLANLVNVMELDLQYNNMQFLAIQRG
jgi:Leucine-rich repeat (LRR) protein